MIGKKNKGNITKLINKHLIPDYKIQGLDLIRDNKPAILFLIWLQKFCSEFLNDWAIHVYFGYSIDDPENRKPIYYKDHLSLTTDAITEYFLEDRAVNFAFNLSRNYEDIKDDDSLIYEMGLIAFHEVMHVVLANVDKNKSQAPVHAAIVNMENNIFPYIYKGSLEDIKHEFF